MSFTVTTSSTTAVTAAESNNAQTKSARFLRNPKDSMKSTWRQDRSQWGLAHYVLNFVDPPPSANAPPVPIHQKTDPVPVMTDWSLNAYVIVHAAWPMLVQELFCRTTGHNLPTLAAFLLYSFAWKLNSLHQLRIIRRLTTRLGFLDGDVHQRDYVPDVGVTKTLLSLQLTTTLRPIFAVFFSYRVAETPALSRWLPVELFLYSIVLDGIFYWYHRCFHEMDSLWPYHRTHHLTKHPDPLLSAYSDSLQEVIEMVLIPMATYGALKLCGLPMNFYDWWVCNQFLIFTEAIGHSGLRAVMSPAGLSTPILRMFGCELTIEDHDIHHRRGWKKSCNYGKQTRLWDRIFGTCGDRVELVPGVIDHDQRVNFPLF